MPFLSWGTEQVRLKVSESSKEFDKQLTLEIFSAARETLTGALDALFERPKSELRIELPEKWTLFWKIKEGESRFLLAHPDKDTWVATLALTQEDLRACINNIRGLHEQGASVVLSEFIEPDRFSNVDLQITHGTASS